MAPSGPPCSQQLSAQTKVHSKEKYKADIKKMISAARDGKRLRFATRIRAQSSEDLISVQSMTNATNPILLVIT